MSFRLFKRPPPGRLPFPLPSGLTSAALAAAVALSSGCGSEPTAEAMPRETFIEAYVALRKAALDTDSAKLAAPDREAILDRLGVTEEELLEFAEVHGRDVEYMRDVWNEVELRLDQAPSPAGPEG